MATRLQTLISRVSEDKLIELVGSSATTLLYELGERHLSPTRLAELLISLEGEKVLINRPEVRKAVIQSLAPMDASDLAQALGLAGNNPYAELKSIKLRKNSTAFFKFLDWFQVTYWEDEEDSVEIEKASKVSTITPSYQLFDHQIDAVKRVKLALHQGDGRVLMHMPTGAGKTRSAMNVIADYFRDTHHETKSVIWLAHVEELCEQAADEFEVAWGYLGNRQVKVIRHYGAYTAADIRNSDNAFIVMSLQSAHAMAFSKRDDVFFALSRSVGLVVIDEAHMATAPTYSHVLDSLAPRFTTKLLGLTATPGRTWDDVSEDLKLAEFFDYQKVTLSVDGFDNPIEYLTSSGYLAEVTTEPIIYDGGHDLSVREQKSVSEFRDFNSSTLKKIGSDADRNLHILLKIEHEAQLRNRIIVFACSVEQAEQLNAVLQLRGVSAACVTGTTNKEVRHEAVQKFKDGEISVICNFGVLTTGFDAPKANVAIIARPTQSVVLYSQMVGRVMRGKNAGGTERCKVVTVVDQKYGFRDLGEAFTLWDDLWEEREF